MRIIRLLPLCALLSCQAPEEKSVFVPIMGKAAVPARVLHVTWDADGWSGEDGVLRDARGLLTALSAAPRRSVLILVSKTAFPAEGELEEMARLLSDGGRRRVLVQWARGAVDAVDTTREYSP